VAPLDRIAVTGGLRVQRTDVVARGEALRASDHLPITADLLFEG
jgi:endonuclease/exonuclease/phosphatase family metal-dependent hydrolase